MNELHYQLDLMRAMNQKLSAREKMYRLLCDTMDYAYIYYSFEKNSVTTLGKWDDFSISRFGTDGTLLSF